MSEDESGQEQEPPRSCGHLDENEGWRCRPWRCDEPALCPLRDLS